MSQESGSVVLVIDVKDSEPRSALFVNGQFGGIEVDDKNSPMGHVIERLSSTLGESLVNFPEGQIKVEVVVTKPAKVIPIDSKVRAKD